jgi:hypothetical protein
MFIISCEYSAVTKSVCNNSLTDVRGFVGKYKWNLAEGNSIPIRVVRKSKGTYGFMGDNGEAFEYKTCKIGRTYIAETELDSEDGSEVFYQILILNIDRNSTILKTVQFTEQSLSDNGVPFVFESAEMQGVEFSAMLIDNSYISSRDLIGLRSQNNGREPFIIKLDK